MRILKKSYNGVGYTPGMPAMGSGVEVDVDVDAGWAAPESADTLVTAYGKSGKTKGVGGQVRGNFPIL